MQLGVGRSNPAAELAATAQRLVSEVPSDNLKQLWETSETLPHCRSELAREKLPGPAVTQVARVIVDDLREQARSYSG